jgi:isopentenyl diphosphate isomerase/L-lactate dehydrogenase-like FMN-dependent dehydrogenase
MNRRDFIGGCAALPALWSTSAPADDSAPPSRTFTRAPPPITAADQVVNVMDFEALARDALPPAHYGYLATGADDDRTVVRNHEAFSQYGIRAYRFNDLTHFDTSLTLWGTSWPSPIYLSAVSAMRAFHPDAELGVARAARARSTQYMISAGSSDPPEEVAKARGAPLWQQIYPTDDWSVTAGLIRRAEAAGSTAIVLTVDSRGARNSETLRRAMQRDNRQCVACHPGNSHDQVRKSPFYAGLDVSRVKGLAPQDQSPAFLDRVRSTVKGRFIAKGVVTGEDAHIAVEHGVDAIIVSNHGGRNEETLQATIECLPEVVEAVRARVPVFLDGGVRRGTDVFKALALGARAVGIGRPYGWGLAAFGQPGVEAVINILNRELTTIMHQAGTVNLAAITRKHLVRVSRDS